MSYAPLWLEIVVTSMLFTATLMAISAHSRGLLRWLILLPNLAFFLGLCAVVAVTAYLKFSLNCSENYFAGAVSLLIACLVGAIVMQRLGARRPAGRLRASASWNLWQLTLGTAICVLVIAMTLWNMDLEIRNRAEVIRAQAGQIMLSVAPANVPDSLNAAISYENAFRALRAEDESLSKISLLDEKDIDSKSPQVEELLKRQAGAIKLLRDARRLQVCRFSHDYSRPSIQMMLPELNLLRVACLLLKLDAQHLLAQGDTRSAIIDIDSMFALSRASGQEPIIVSGLVMAGLNTFACRSLADTVPAVKNSAELDELHMGDPGSLSRAMQRDIYGEEAFGLAIFADIGSGRSDMHTLENNDPGAKLPLREKLSLLPYRLFFLRTDVRGYEQLMDQVRRWTEEPYYEAAPEMQSQEARRIHESGILTRTVAPAFSHLFEEAARAEALHNAALSAVAITRYRLDHGALPPTLEALVPNYLDVIPADPFNGQVIRYRKGADDWRVYSVGRTGKDEGGSTYDSHAHTGNVSLVVKNALQ